MVIVAMYFNIILFFPLMSYLLLLSLPLTLFHPLLLLLLHLPLSLSLSRQDRADQPPTTMWPPHLSQKSHISQTRKPKSNYTHNLEHQRPNKITKSLNLKQIKIQNPQNQERT